MNTTSTIRPAVLVAITLALASCSETISPGPDVTPPVACLRLDVFAISSDCPGSFHLLVDPRCSSDDRSDRDRMTVRWDFENDGIWDTDFLPMEVNRDFQPTTVSDPLWTARCEVRDEAGNSAQAVESMDLSTSDLVPTYPDIIAGALTMPDSIEAGEGFLVLIAERCWVDPSSVSYKTEVYANEMLIGEVWKRCRPNVGFCESHGSLTLPIATPGIYEVEVVLDAENVLAESNENNNTARRTLVVTPR